MATISPDAQAVISQAGQGALEYIQKQGGYGNKLTSGEATKLLQGFAPQMNVAQQVQQGIAGLTSQQYQFDPSQYLPGIQQQAESIYSPQQAQLEAIRMLQQSQSQDTRIQTEKDFEKRMQQEVEAINRRGAFFSGGAIQNEQDIRSEQGRALQQLDLQASAANFSNYAQQAMLAADKANFIQDRLVNAESSAYARWTDARNFSLQALQTQYQVYSNERDFARSVFESDRSFNLQQEQMDMERKQFEQNYSITAEQFEQAKQEFSVDMKIKNLSYDQALKNFKEKYATTNYGVLGTTEDGTDKLEWYRNMYSGPTKIEDIANSTTLIDLDNINDFSGIPGLTFDLP
jgi:hypothetical protein